MKSLDKVTKSRVQSRLTRLLENNFGDHKKLDSEISELRLKFGSGYRIYGEIYNERIKTYNRFRKLHS